MTKTHECEMKECKSSQVKAHGYDKEKKMLVIEFNGGGKYQYADVSQAEYDDLCNCESVGKHLHSHIKGKHEFTKMENPHA